MRGDVWRGPLACLVSCSSGETGGENGGAIEQSREIETGRDAGDDGIIRGDDKGLALFERARAGCDDCWSDAHDPDPSEDCREKARLKSRWLLLLICLWFGALGSGFRVREKARLKSRLLLLLICLWFGALGLGFASEVQK